MKNFSFCYFFPVSNIHTDTFFLYNKVEQMTAASGMAHTGEVKNMKKTLLILLLLFCLFLVLPALAETVSEETIEAEWTVLFYFCGSDLESYHGLASRDIEDITNCLSPYNAVYRTGQFLGIDSELLPEQNEKINVVIQTGGSKKWDREEINPKALQRWAIDDSDGLFNCLSLKQELPLQSMADSETLASFIRWGTETYPAKKYALVLWGHGDGAKTGILLDELFNNEIMQLDELNLALKNGGAFFETIVLDACMMANLETACAVKDYAAWMVASEEIVPGQGTAVKSWLQELYNHPTQNGKLLGRNICEMTQTQYANTDNEQAKDILTWSVIDLSKIGRVDELAEHFFELMHSVYTKHPDTLRMFASYLYNAEDYGDAQQNMRDTASVFYRSSSVLLMGENLRNDMIDALNDAVVYCVRGSGRSEARGLSFCYATDFLNEELETYSHNCMSAHYLALLDAITPWTAPDWVFETVERLPEISTLPAYDLKVEKRMTPQGVPGISITKGYSGGVYYCLYRKDETKNQATRLGRTVCRAFFPDEDTTLWSAVEPWMWPSIDGEFCDIELISATDTQALYNVPIQVGPDMWYLRYGRDYEMFLDDVTEKIFPSKYTVYDSDTEMLCRNVKSLSQMAGQEYRLLYPISGDTGKKTYYSMGKFQTLYRSLEMEAKQLPAGTYYLEYEVQDMFMRPIMMERIEMYWDGKKLSFPEGFAWEGTMKLSWINQ